MTINENKTIVKKYLIQFILLTKIYLSYYLQKYLSYKISQG